MKILFFNIFFTIIVTLISREFTQIIIFKQACDPTHQIMNRSDLKACWN